MASLKIWPEALASGQNVPDATWVGQWVRAVGLVEPVHSAGSGAGHHKDVAISITDSSQLHRLTATEARHCLRAQRSRTRPALDTTAGVKTDRVVTEAAPQPVSVPSVASPKVSSLATTPAAGRPTAVGGTRPAPATPARIRTDRVIRNAAPQHLVMPSPALPAAPVPPRPAAGRATHVRGGPWRRWSWAGAAFLAALAIFAVVDRQDPSIPDPSKIDAQAERQPVPAATTAPPAAQADASRLESQEVLGKARLPIATMVGTLAIGSAGLSDARHVVLLNGQVIPRLRDDAISVTHRAVFSDREVVVGFTRCNGAIALCGLQQPFWLELRTGLPPKVRRATGLWVGTGAGAGAVVASTDGVQVDLGVWQGERRSARLTASGEIVVARQREPRRSLSHAECATVIKAAESCATCRDCSSFKSSARPIPPPRWARLTRLYHESTGFDAASFRALRVRSCELGLTPSDGFIQRNVCSGARPDQWPPGDPTAAL